ncbi:MAG: ribonuclease P protein component [Geminicoccaceae bacterium]|nr:ribonuclease P protein component [Geminicoccaceae bacterium]
MSPGGEAVAVSSSGEAAVVGPDGPAVVRLKRRAEFLHAARGRKRAFPSLVLQRADRPGTGEDPASIGVGFTASRKVGGAVQRNRAKRRLRAAAADLVPRLGRPGHDYVLVARGRVLTCPYAEILRDLERGLMEGA